MSGSRVLDVATGPGYVAAEAAKRGASVVGVDIAQEMVDLARSLYPGIEFQLADAEDLPFEDNSFDAVVENFRILHLARPERATMASSRVLKPGGRIALTVWDLPERCRFLGVVYDAVQAVGAKSPENIPPGPPFFHFSVGENFSQLLTQTGLKGVRVDTISFTHRFSTPEDLWDVMIGATVRTQAYILGQPPDVRRRIRNLFEQNVADYAVKDGRFRQ